MADARRRAKRASGTGAGAPADGGGAVAAPEAPPPGPPAEGPVFDDELAPPPSAAEPAALAPEERDLASREEAAGGASSVPGRIELPASGLAEDILAHHESAVREVDAAREPVPEAPEESARTRGDAAPAAGHSLSFFAAPVQEQRAAVEATEHLVTFYLDREEYGMDVRQVQEIRRVGEITAVPRAPEFVRGVINLRGRILPVLDMKTKLGLGEVADGRAARIVVVRVRERLLGLLVDGASQVPKIPVSRIEPPPEEVVERGGDYIRGVAKLDDRLIILVDLERLLAQELRAGAARAATERAESA